MSCPAVATMMKYQSRCDVVHRAAVDLAVGDDAGQVVLRAGPPVDGELVEVLDELHDRWPSSGRAGSSASPMELGIGGAEDALGELEHERLVLLGHAVDVHDHAQRVGLGDVAGEVARRRRGRASAACTGRRARRCGAGACPTTAGLNQSLVTWRGGRGGLAVEVHERRRAAACRRRASAPCRRRGRAPTGRVEPPLVVPGHREHVGVAGEHPERLVARRSSTASTGVARRIAATCSCQASMSAHRDGSQNSSPAPA